MDTIGELSIAGLALTGQGFHQTIGLVRGHGEGAMTQDTVPLMCLGGYVITFAERVNANG